MDYSSCYYDVQDEFPSSVIPVSVKSLVNACTSSNHPWYSEPCILIKGKPGQGDSFLISRLCQYWALGYGMRNITLMFWIHCSQFQNQEITLNQLLSQLVPIETQDISERIMNKQGKDVIFVLDGYDQEQSVDFFPRPGFSKVSSKVCCVDSIPLHTKWSKSQAVWTSYSYWHSNIQASVTILQFQTSSDHHKWKPSTSI